MDSRALQGCLGNRVYSLTREGWRAGKFTLESEGQVFATATKPSWLQRRFILFVGSEEFEIAARGAFRRSFDLKQGAREIGSVEPLSIWSRGAVVALPEQMDPAVRVFVLWLVLLLWRRDAAAAAG